MPQRLHLLSAPLLAAALAAAALADGPPPPQASVTAITDQDRSFWSFQPPKATEPPAATADSPWVRTRVDRFIAARLQDKQLRPRGARDHPGSMPLGDTTKGFRDSITRLWGRRCPPSRQLGKESG